VKRVRSLHTRVIVGSMLWAIGLVGIAYVVSMAMIHRYPASLGASLHAVLAVGVLLMVTALAALRSILSTFRDLRDGLSSMRTGQARRFEGSYPSEIQPLVDELNTLFDNRERAVARALTTAGDLAHGLKTPLALLTQEAERAKASGHDDIAIAIDQQVERMRRQVDYHLAQARAVASGKTSGAHASVSESVDGLTRTLAILYADRGLRVDVTVAADLNVSVQREDLDEMLGNVLDNAYKWAKEQIAVKSSATEGSVTITVEDDGPGLAPESREKVLQRGVRADEAAPGSGLGLAIVRDLAQLYGGAITLCESSAGGLLARLELPAT
jgi:signal transduction histidine kinase